MLKITSLKIKSKAVLFFTTMILGGEVVLSAEMTGESLEQLALAEELDLRSLLEEQTEIATKTGINADYVPGMVTILKGGQLELQGKKTVWEALGTISGMEISLDQIGNQIVKVRHVGGGFASGNLKIMLNGMALNSSLTAMAQPVMDMPIEQIDRIEVIRGPGSAIHGEYAYAGVVNVISKKTAKNVFAGVGKFDNGMIGGTYSWSWPQYDLTTSLNMAFSDTDGADMHHDTDALFLNGVAIGMSQAGVSNAPGPSSEDRRYKSILFNLEYDDLMIDVQWLENRHGQHYGTFHVLPTDDERDYTRNEYKTVELKKRYKYSHNLSANYRLGWYESITQNDISILPPGYSLWHFPSFPTVLENGYQTAAYYKEQKYYLGTDLFWQPIDKHKLFLAVNYSKTRVKDAWQENNIHLNGTVSPADDYPIPTPLKFTAEDGLNWPKEGAVRELSSITLQDEFGWSELLYLTFGVRYDYYSDVGSNLSPRLAAVYRWNEQNIFKAQYAQAFRPPTFFETAWTPNLDPQTIDTVDFSYMYRGTGLELKLSLFHSKLKNLITATAPLGFVNGDGAKVYGSELEGEYQFNEKLDILANLSYSKSKLDETGEPIPRVANWLSNVFINYQYSDYLGLTLHYQYVGDRRRESHDPRENLDAYSVVNLSGKISDLFQKGTSINFGVDNLFKADVRYPSIMTSDLIGNSFPSYQDDYPRPEQVWWLRLKIKLD